MGDTENVFFFNLRHQLPLPPALLTAIGWILLTAKLTGCENLFLFAYGGGWTLSTFHAFMFVQGFTEEVTRSR